jgi:hypothetical protein
MRTLFGTLLRSSGLAIHGVAVEHDRFRHFWTKGLRVRDREAPGSNPGPPTNF